VLGASYEEAELAEIGAEWDSKTMFPGPLKVNRGPQLAGQCRRGDVFGLRRFRLHLRCDDSVVRWRQFRPYVDSYSRSLDPPGPGVDGRLSKPS